MSDQLSASVVCILRTDVDAAWGADMGAHSSLHFRAADVPADAPFNPAFNLQVTVPAAEAERFQPGETYTLSLGVLRDKE